MVWFTPPEAWAALATLTVLEVVLGIDNIILISVLVGRMLALSFLILVGMALIAEGIDLHIPKGYIYFAMAFSVAVEMLNLRLRKITAPVHLRKKQL